VKRCLTLLLFSLLVCGCALTQTAPDNAMQKSVCGIVKNPEQFAGKLVTVRAQIRAASGQFWLNNSADDSLQLGRFCGWLPAEFAHSTNLLGSTAFGTFTGKIVINESSPSRRVRFVIEQEADIYQQKILTGLVFTPRLFPSVDTGFRQREHLIAPDLKFPSTVPRPNCQLPTGVAPLRQFSTSATPVFCSFICNAGAPIGVCTKG
jgi:hypothetical protein